jgi:hypothetical protein
MALPPELPPAEHGPLPFITAPYAEFMECDPMPNSSMFVLPQMIAPCSLSSRTTVASYGLWKSRSIFDPHVVGKSTVHMLSLMAILRPIRPSGLDAEFLLVTCYKTLGEERRYHGGAKSCWVACER